VTSSPIDPELLRSFEDASAALADCIRAAVRGFYADPPHGWEAWELWRTPEPWETRVLSNLERYHGHLQAALRAYHAGDIRRITHAAGAYKGLAKDIEFDTGWMTEQNRLAVDRAIEQVVRALAEISCNTRQFVI
jgi:hypothetical protein